MRDLSNRTRIRCRRDDGQVMQSALCSREQAGASHTCGLTSSGMAYCRGRGDQGEIGNGTTATDSLPVPIGGGPNFAVISAGSEFTCGLTTAA
jgi:alpha-tubulin suppressor-like RCC1 family protein